MTNKLLKTEQGRSMVEMLGVLAVVGLLSVMAFAGFRYALNKHYANEILNEANKRAVIVAGQIGFNQGTPSLSEFTNNTFTGGSFDTTVTTNSQTEQFGLKVSNVPEEVCQQILMMIDDNTMLRRLSSEGNMALGIANCATTESSYFMVYNDDLTYNDKQRSCQTDSECETACGTCTIPEGAIKGVCMNECEIASTTCTTNDECANAGVCAGCVKAEGAESGTCQYACEELEYLEGTGRQFFNTGISGNNDNLTVITEFDWRSFTSNYPGLFGNYMSNGLNRFGILQPGDTNSTYLFVATNTKAVGEGLIKIYNITRQTRHTISMNTHNVVVDGSTSYTSSTIKASDNGSNIYLFCAGPNDWGNPSHVRFYFFQIRDNSTLVRDFIPVLDPNGTPAMLDRVEPKLYYNQGTGQFSYGRKAQQ